MVRVLWRLEHKRLSEGALMRLLKMAVDVIQTTIAKSVKNSKTAHIRHQCKKTAVLSYHRCLINTGFEKMNNI